MLLQRRTDIRDRMSLLIQQRGNETPHSLSEYQKEYRDGWIHALGWVMMAKQEVVEDEIS